MPVIDIRIPVEDLSDADRQKLVRLAKAGLKAAVEELARRDAVPKTINGAPHNNKPKPARFYE